jgi:Notch-like protein
MDNTAPIYYLLQSFKCTFPNFAFNSLSTRDIKNIIKSLKTKQKFFGYDEISTKLLKISFSFIISPLTHICYKSLSLGIFPDHLKYSEVKSVFKKRDKQSISNYRPISVVTSFSKVLEKAAYIQLYEHSIKNNILTEEQFGFKSKSATNDVIYKLTNEILIALNNKLMVGGLFCGLEKAFDCVSHKILLSKLEFCGVKGKTKLWFESYFRNRYQRVSITKSKLIEITCLLGKK